MLRANLFSSSKSFISSESLILTTLLESSNLAEVIVLSSLDFNVLYNNAN